MSEAHYPKVDTLAAHSRSGSLDLRGLWQPTWKARRAPRSARRATRPTSRQTARDRRYANGRRRARRAHRRRAGRARRPPRRARRAAGEDERRRPADPPHRRHREPRPPGRDAGRPGERGKRRLPVLGTARPPHRPDHRLGQLRRAQRHDVDGQGLARGRLPAAAPEADAGRPATAAHHDPGQRQRGRAGDLPRGGPHGVDRADDRDVPADRQRRRARHVEQHGRLGPRRRTPRPVPCRRARRRSGVDRLADERDARGTGNRRLRRPHGAATTTPSPSRTAGSCATRTASGTCPAWPSPTAG